MYTLSSTLECEKFKLKEKIREKLGKEITPDLIASCLSPLLLGMSIRKAFSLTFSSDETLETGILKASGNVYTLLFGISSGIALVCLAICLFGAMLTSDDKLTAQFKAWGKRITFCWIGLNLLPHAQKFIKGIIGDAGNKLNNSVWGATNP